jgi:hypothetical protein
MIPAAPEQFRPQPDLKLYFAASFPFRNSSAAGPRIKEYNSTAVTTAHDWQILYCNAVPLEFGDIVASTPFLVDEHYDAFDLLKPNDTTSTNAAHTKASIHI